MSPVLLMLILMFLLILVGVFVGYALGNADRRPPKELLAAVDARDALIDDLRETAWQHRDIDPHLSMIFIDKIRQATTTKKELP